MSHDQVTSELRKSVLDELEKEFARAKAKFPGSDRLLAALAEEVGELAEEILNPEPNVFRIREEAIQVAVVALRIGEEGCTVGHLEAAAIGYPASALGAKARDFLEGGASPGTGEGSPCPRSLRSRVAAMLAMGDPGPLAPTLARTDLDARLRWAIKSGDRLLQLLEETEPTCGLVVVDDDFSSLQVLDPTGLIEAERLEGMEGAGCRP